MIDSIVEKLLSQDASIEDLRAYLNKTNAINKIIAAHPNVDSDLLDELLEFWGEDSQGVDFKVVAIALRNPVISFEKIMLYGSEHPKSVLDNKNLPWILRKRPDLYKNIPEILSEINCPERLLVRASKQKNGKYWPDILVNQSIAAALSDVVNPSNLFALAKKRLQDFKDKSTDDLAKEYLDLYLKTTRPFFVPRFQKFDGNILEHRLSDQVLCGFPFTSKKWPWPVGSNDLHMQPIAQINLENVGNLLRLPLGNGLLQIWGCINMGSRDHFVRIIPSTDLYDVVDDFYPPNPVWLKVDDTGSSIIFEGCIVSSFNLDDYRQFKVENCRVEWVDMGYMFYPSLYKRIFSPLRQDEWRSDSFDEPSSWLFSEKLDKKIRKLQLPTGLNPYGKRLFVLGGYGDGLGNAWHTDNGDLILYHSIDYGYKVTIALYCKTSDDGEPVFTVGGFKSEVQHLVFQ